MDTQTKFTSMQNYFEKHLNKPIDYLYRIIIEEKIFFTLRYNIYLT